MSMNEVLREFILETQENLAQLDLDLVALERNPTERETLARTFRTLHTLKGTAGFLGLQQMQAVAHAAESLLSALRDGELLFNASIAEALLGVVDAIRRMLTALEVSGEEGEADFADLIQTLELLRRRKSSPQQASGWTTASVYEARPAPSSAPASPPPAPEQKASIPEVQPAARSAPIAPPVSPPPVILSPPKAPEPVSKPSAPIPSPDAPSPMASLVESTSPEPAAPRMPPVSGSAIRVDVGLLDKLMTLVGELVLARNQIVQFSSAQENAPFQGTVQRLNLLTVELQANVMKTRMQPIHNVWSKFPRVIRDLAVACGKQVRINMEGQDTELDRNIIEAIRDPLTHLVRNAVDHGIEPPTERLARGKPAQGRLLLHAFHESGKVILEITDDGRGIDPRRIADKAIQAKLLSPELADRMSDSELVDLIFQPGFSTAEKITQFSGRGVGMDVVRTNIEKIGGTVSIESRLGRGTTVKMKIPLTLAIIPALIVTCCGDRYAIPQVSLLELVHLEGEPLQQGIEYIHGTPVHRLRGNLLPLVYLNRELGLVEASANPPFTVPHEINIVVLQAEDRQFGLVVDLIHDTEEIVVKPLQKQLKGISAFAGATIMGDGKAALILDILGLAQKANVVSGTRESALGEKAGAVPERPVDRQTVLLFATRDGTRMAIPLAQVARLEEFPRSALERVGTQDVIQYRDEILSLFYVSRLLRQKRRRSERRGNGHRSSSLGELQPLAEDSAAGDTVQVVVYAGQEQPVGLVVDQILDIVEETITTRSRPTRPGVLFTAVIQGRVTEFLDIEGLLRTADLNFFKLARAVAAES
jgi:two-component system, chemotaxis family, sensor kinase CheA